MNPITRYMQRNLEQHPGRVLILLALVLVVTGVPALINSAMQQAFDGLGFNEVE